MEAKDRVEFVLPHAFVPQTYPPSPFELGVVDQLKGLAAEIESGNLHIEHFALTSKNNKQGLEIEVA